MSHIFVAYIVSDNNVDRKALIKSADALTNHQHESWKTSYWLGELIYWTPEIGNSHEETDIAPIADVLAFPGPLQWDKIIEPDGTVTELPWNNSATPDVELRAILAKYPTAYVVLLFPHF